LKWSAETLKYKPVSDQDVINFASPDEKKLAIEKYNRAVHQIQNGNADMAAITLRTLVREYPLFVQAAQLNACCQMIWKDIDNAVESLNGLLKGNKLTRGERVKTVEYLNAIQKDKKNKKRSRSGPELPFEMERVMPLILEVPGEDRPMSIAPREEIDTLLSGKVYGEPPKNAKSRRRVTIGSSLRHSESMEGERLNRARIAAERRAKAKAEERRRQLARNEAKEQQRKRQEEQRRRLEAKRAAEKREREEAERKAREAEAKRLEEERKAREAEAKRLEEERKAREAEAKRLEEERKAREEELQHSAVLNSQTHTDQSDAANDIEEVLESTGETTTSTTDIRPFRLDLNKEKTSDLQESPKSSVDKDPQTTESESDFNLTPLVRPINWSSVDSVKKSENIRLGDPTEDAGSDLVTNDEDLTTEVNSPESVEPVLDILTDSPTKLPSRPVKPIKKTKNSNSPGKVYRRQLKRFRLTPTEGRLLIGLAALVLVFLILLIIWLVSRPTSDQTSLESGINQEDISEESYMAAPSVSVEGLQTTAAEDYVLPTDDVMSERDLASQQASTDDTTE
jgi:hypothetical protein